MPITPYTSPVEAPMIDTYVPIPFQEMMQAGAMTQQRYDENISMTDELSGQLDQINALGDVAVPGLNEIVKFNDKKIVQEEYENFDNRISDLTKSIQDKSSPEYRQKIRGIISDFRRSSGPRGKMGVAMSNVEEYKTFKKKLAENPQLANSPHLMMPFIKKFQQHAQLSASGEITPLDLSGSVGKTVDVNTKLAASLKNMASTVLSESEVEKYGDNVAGLYRAIQEKGIDPSRITNTVAGLIATDPEMRTDLQQQAEYFNLQNPGSNITASDIAQQHAGAMANIFTQQDRVIKTFTDPTEVAAIKKASERKLEIDNLMSGRLVMGKKGIDVSNSGELKAQIEDLTSAKTASINTLKQRASVYGIEVDDNGNISNTIDSEGKDRFDELKVFSDSIKLLEDRLSGYKNFDKRLRQQANIPQDLSKHPAYIAKYEKSVTEAKDFLQESANEGTWSSELESKMLDPNVLHRDAIARLEKEDKSFALYNELIQKAAKDGTEVAGFKQLPSKVTESLTDIFVNTRADVNAMPSALYGAGTENAGIDYKEDADAFEELRIARKSEDGKIDTTPYLMGLTLDPTAGGKPMLLWNVKDNEGNHKAYVKEEVPVTLVRDLIKSGDIDSASYIINSTLTDELGVLGDGRNQEQTINLDIVDKGVDAPTAKIYNRGTVHPDYKVTMKYGDETKDHYPKTKGELIALLTDTSKKYEISKIKK